MSDIIYVPCTIVIETPYFLPTRELGAFFKTPPVGAEIIYPNNKVDGFPILFITKEKAPSIFKSYYSASDIQAFGGGVAVFFGNEPNLILSEFNNRIVDILTLVNSCKSDTEISPLINRLSLASSVAALDTFICDIILFKATKDLSSFTTLLQLLPNYQLKKLNATNRLNDMWANNTFDSIEQQIIDLALHKSYSNITHIRDDLKAIYNVNITSNKSINKSIKESIENRHLIVHRSGRDKNGKVLTFSYDKIINRISEIKNYAYDIFNLIPR